MVFVPEGDDVVYERRNSGLCNGGSFCVASDISDDFFSVGEFFPDMDVPLNGRGISFVENIGIQFYEPILSGLPESSDDLMSEGFFQCEVVEVGVVDPLGFAF